MPFAPNVQDRRDQLVMQGSQEIAKYKYEGAQALGSGIAEGVKSAASSLGSALSQVGQQASERAAQYSEAAGQLSAYKQIGEKRGQDMSWLADLEAKHKNKPAELLGALAVVGQDFKAQIAREQMQAQYDGARKLAEDKATIAANAPGRVLRTANGFVQQVNGAWQPVADPQGNPVAAPVTGSSGGQNLGTALAGLSAQADAEEIARIQGEIAAGNQKPGPDFLPDGIWFGAKPYKQQLVEKQAAVAAGGGAPAGGAPQAWQSPDQVKAAAQSGQITLDQARQILQSQFGFR